MNVEPQQPKSGEQSDGKHAVPGFLDTLCHLRSFMPTMSTTVEPMVNVVYDFEQLGGSKTTEVIPHRALSFHKLLSYTAGSISLIDDNTIYIVTGSCAYFRVDSPEMLDFIIEHLHEMSETITVIVRPTSQNQNDPNVPALRPISGPPVHPMHSYNPLPKNVIDPLSRYAVEDLELSRTIKLLDDKVQITVDRNFLLNFLQNARLEGKSVFDVHLSAEDEQGATIWIDFSSHELWLNYLCRGHDEATKFEELFAEGTKAIDHYKHSLDDFRSNYADIWWKILFFARDLQRFNEHDDHGPEQRLRAVECDPDQYFYFSSIYFDDQVERILSLPGPTGPTLREILQYKFRDEDGEVCTRHTVFPVVQRFFLRETRKVSDISGFPDRYRQFEKEWTKKQKKRAKN